MAYKSKPKVITALYLGLILATGLSAQTKKNPVAHNESAPNIIFILTDDQRWDAISYSGNKIIQTPQMDKLAREGVYFRNGMVTTPICSASRATIFSGVHERTHKYTFQASGLLDEYLVDAYPRLLRKAGYYTGFYGKFGVNCNGKEEMFDVIEDYDRNNRYKDYRGFYYKTLGNDTVHLTRYTGQKALDFIEDAPDDKPFCLSLSFSAPHAHDPAPEQYFWQEEPGKLYQNMEMPGPALADDTYFEQLPEYVRNGFNRLRWTWRYDTPEKYQHSVKGYYRMINGIDREIAKIRQKLAEKGVDKNTVIILMGDNGYFLGERQMAGKWLMYDNSVRVPLIVHDPRSGEHLEVDDMALNLDIPATILDLANIEQPASYQGKSLVPVVTGEEKSLNRDTVLIEHLWEFDKIQPSEGVRTNEWKYFRYVNDQSWEELYHLKRDPRETSNLAGNSRYEKVLKELRAKTNELAKKFEDPYSGVPLALTVEFLRNPGSTKVTDRTPVFSWVVPEEAVMQQAYQVLVSSSRELSDKNIGDVWDSKVVRSSQSTNIEFKGEALKPNSSYYWKVRIFDRNNRLSGYSGVQPFKTGEFDEFTSKTRFHLEKIAPAALQRNSDGSYFVDFGKAAFGTLELKLKPRKKEVLTVRLGEKLLDGEIDGGIDGGIDGESDGKIDRNPGGTIRYQEVKLEVTPRKTSYIVELKPDERNTLPVAVALPDSFPVIIPFRYVEIEGAPSLTKENLVQLAYFYEFDETASAFSSSDTLLNQIWDLCKYSIKATSFAGLYVDGDRERIPYEADAYLNQLSHYAVDNEYTLARSTIEYFMKYPTWPTEWQLHVVLMVYQDYMYTGNTELIEKYYEELKHKTLMALEYRDGLISTASDRHNGVLMQQLGFADTTKRLRDIVDWPQKGGFGGVQGETDDFVFKPVNAVINSFYYKNMEVMAEFATLLGKPEEALDFEQRAARVKKSFNDLLFVKEKGYYRDGIGTDHGSLHASMLPLAFDLVPEAYKADVAQHVKSRGMACSVYGAQYLMEALYKAGEQEYALQLMTDTSERSWYNMIKVGSTITMEAWDMKYKPNADWNHAWGAAPANIIPRWMWGIRPTTPGWERIVVQPQLAGLQESTITVPSIRGSVECNFKRLGPRERWYSIELPANMVGDMVLPATGSYVVTRNGEPVMTQFGSIRLEPGENIIELKN